MQIIYLKTYKRFIIYHYSINNCIYKLKEIEKRKNYADFDVFV